MSRKELIATLQTEAETIRSEAETRMNALLEAAQTLQALDTETRPATERARPANDEKPSLTSLVRKIFTENPAKVYDRPQLKELLLAAHPDDATRIKTGLYQSVEFLLAKNEIRRAPGGFEFGPKPSQPS